MAHSGTLILSCAVVRSVSLALSGYMAHSLFMTLSFSLYSLISCIAIKSYGSLKHHKTIRSYGSFLQFRSLMPNDSITYYGAIFSSVSLT